jgi:hypothetical protein
VPIKTQYMAGRSAPVSSRRVRGRGAVTLGLDPGVERLLRVEVGGDSLTYSLPTVAQPASVNEGNPSTITAASPPALWFPMFPPPGAAYAQNQL